MPSPEGAAEKGPKEQDSVVPQGDRRLPTAGVPLSPWTSLSQAMAADPRLCPGSPLECPQVWLSPWVPHHLFFSPTTGTQFPEAQWGPPTPKNLQPWAPVT